MCGKHFNSTHVYYLYSECIHIYNLQLSTNRQKGKSTIQLITSPHTIFLIVIDWLMYLDKYLHRNDYFHVFAIKVCYMFLDFVLSQFSELSSCCNGWISASLRCLSPSLLGECPSIYPLFRRRCVVRWVLKYAANTAAAPTRLIAIALPMNVTACL